MYRRNMSGKLEKVVMFMRLTSYYYVIIIIIIIIIIDSSLLCTRIDERAVSVF